MSDRRFLGIALTEGVLPRHLSVYLLVALFSSGFAGILAFLEPGLWQAMEIPKDQWGLYTGRLRAVQEIFYISLMGVFGAASDKLGRRGIYTFGLTFISAGLALYPWATSIAQLVAFRSLIGLGGAAMMAMLVAVIADYTENETRSRANGLQGFFVTLGALFFSVLGFMPMFFKNAGYEELDAMRATFAICGGIGLFAALLAYFGLSKTLAVTQAESDTLLYRMGQGLKAARQDSRIALSYGAAFISRGDLAVAGAFMGLWIGKYASTVMSLDSSAITQEVTIRVLTTIGGALTGSLLLGFLFERVNRITAVSIASGLAAISYSAMSQVNNPMEGWVFGLLFFIGVSEISAFVSSQALVGEYAPDKVRGAVIGFFGVSGAIGILAGSLIGGQLFEKIGPGSPFLLFGFLNLLVCIWSLRVNQKNNQGSSE
jgi:MFS family permease